MKTTRGQGIKKVSDLFVKYKTTLRAPQSTVIVAFIEAVDAVCDVSLKKECCSYSPRTRIISIKSSGTIKTEILLNKEAVLHVVKKDIGEKSAPKDIV